MSQIAQYTGRRSHFPVTTTTTTTTTTRSYGPSGHFNGNNAPHCYSGNDGLQLSSGAQKFMMGQMVRQMVGQMLGQILGGPFGEMMNALGIGGPCGQQQGQMHPFSNAHPGFGQPRNGNMMAQMAEEAQRRMENAQSMQAALRRATTPGNYNPQPRRGAMNALQNLTGVARGAASGAINGAMDANIPQAPHGKATEMKAGQTMKAPNGSVVKWGKDGNVGIKYKDPNGQMRTVDVKNGMLSMDGGKPIKLENVGQILKLPNGDVIGLGNNPQGPEGKKLCRVVLADNVDQIKTEPASATNVYDINMMQETQNAIVPTRYDFNYNSSSFDGHCGHYHSNSFSASVTTGTPVVLQRAYQILNPHSVR